MRIIETNINDFPSMNLNESKIELANEIINFVNPIFSNDYNKKIREIKELKKSLSDKKEKIKNNKIELENLLKIFSKKDKESQLIRKMGKLIQTGLIQESMKNEMSVMLKSFENMEEEKITSYLNEVMRLVSQKFAKT
jgi:GTPase involved in cell partitioning and DNA repair